MRDGAYIEGMDAHMKKTAVFLIAFLLFGISPALGSSGGYIVKLRTDAVQLQGSFLGLSPVTARRGFYRTPSYSYALSLLRRGEALYIEPDGEMTLYDLPNDLDLSRQTSYASMSAAYAWQQGIAGSGVKIAVIDSGLMPDHEDINPASISAAVNYTAIGTAGDVTDTVGHGTFVAGVICAKTNNGVGIAGIAPGAQLVVLKCFDQNGTQVSTIVQAIYDAVDLYHCDIINMSFGTPMNYNSLLEAVNYAADKGVILTAAAGNSGSSDLSYPAAYEQVIGVGSVNQAGVVSSFSQRGTSVDVTAVGENVYSLDYLTPGGYKYASGTSYSAPSVAALAALAKSLSPSLSASDFFSLLKKTVLDDGLPGYDADYGYGVMNVLEALYAMQNPSELAIAPFAVAMTEGNLNLNMHLVNNSGNGSTGSAVAALYNGNRLIEMRSVEAQIASQSHFYYHFTFSPLSVSGTYTVKQLFVESLRNPSPKAPMRLYEWKQ